jgi:hypothetical protein
MEHLSLVVDNAHDDAVLSASSEAMPFANTKGSKGHLREYPWRSTATTLQTLGGIFPERSIALLALTGANFTQAAVVTVKLYLATVLVATEVIAANGTDTWHKWIAPIAADQYEITLSDAGNAAGYLEFRQFILGPRVQAAYNFARGADLSDVYDVEHIRTAGGSLRAEGTSLKHRKARISLSYVPEADRLVLQDALALFGPAKPVFVSLFPGAGGRMETDHQFVAMHGAEFQRKLVSDSFWSVPAVEFLEC